MKAPRTLPLLVALTLLLGQQAGLAHALSHLDPGTQSKEAPAHTLLCAKCASFEQLSAMVPTSTAASPQQLSSEKPTSVADYGCVRRTVTAFRSRAPPSLS
jgi:hypothetical protein